jgi:hypothetical protein
MSSEMYVWSRVGVLCISGTDANPRALVMNFASHRNALKAVRYIISADYTGYATEYIENAG